MVFALNMGMVNRLIELPGDGEAACYLSFSPSDPASAQNGYGESGPTIHYNTISFVKI